MLISRLLGLVKSMVMASYLGLGWEATAFNTANIVPEAIFFIVAGGAIGSEFIPTFATYFAKDDEKGAWQLFSAVLNLIVLIVSLLALVAILFAPQIVRLFLPELVVENQDFQPPIPAKTA